MAYTPAKKSYICKGFVSGANVLGWHVCRAKSALKFFCSSYESSHENAPKLSPNIFEPLFCGSEKFCKIHAQFPAKISL